MAVKHTDFGSPIRVRAQTLAAKSIDFGTRKKIFPSPPRRVTDPLTGAPEEIEREEREEGGEREEGEESEESESSDESESEWGDNSLD